MKSGTLPPGVVNALAALLCWLAFDLPTPAAANGAPVDGYRVMNVYPHDTSAYTQGLIYLEGFLFESTGLKGQSSLRKVKLESGQIVQKKILIKPTSLKGWRSGMIGLFS